MTALSGCGVGSCVFRKRQPRRYSDTHAAPRRPRHQHRQLPVWVLAAAAIAICLVGAGPVLAADTSPDRLRAQIDRDQTALSALIKRVSDTPPAGLGSDLSSLADALQSGASTFETSEGAYRGMTFQDPTLREAHQLASSAAASVAVGARQAAGGLRSLNEAGYRSGINEVNAGARSLEQAVDRYNAYAQAHPSRSATVADWADGPLRWTLWLAPFVLVPGAYLLLAGAVLNQWFRHRVARIVRGEQPQALRAGSLTRLYGVHLVLLVGLAYMLLAFVGVLVLACGLEAARLILQAPRIPIALVIAVPAVVVACYWGMVNGLLGIGRGARLGVGAGAVDEPRLWSLSRETAAAVGTRPADILWLSPLPGISVHEEGGLIQLLLGRTRRVLTLGAPSLIGLTVPQFQAILGHEYGHLSNRDTAWSSLTFRAASAVQQTVASMDAVGRRGGWFALVALINPARWLVWLYLLLFRFLTSGFSRMREVFADATAIERYGAEAFKAGLRTVVLNDALFGSRGLPALVSLVREGRDFRGIYDALGATRDGMPPEELGVLFQQATARRPSAFDSHPPVSDRLRYADRFPSATAASSTGDEPVTGCFQDWAQRSHQLATLLVGRLRTA